MVTDFREADIFLRVSFFLNHPRAVAGSLHTGDKAMGAYPTVVHRDGGDKALVVQDFWTGKYLGRINVTFDAETGRVQSWQGNSPILLDHTVPKGKPSLSAVLGVGKELIEKFSVNFCERLLPDRSRSREVCPGETPLG